MPTKVIELTVPQDIVNTRLDVWLAQTLRDASRSYLQKLIKNGKVRCSGQPVTIPRTEVHRGMSVTVELPEPEPIDAVPQDIVTRIINLRDSKESLLSEVRVIPVTTKSGRRTLK